MMAKVTMRMVAVTALALVAAACAQQPPAPASTPMGGMRHDMSQPGGMGGMQGMDMSQPGGMNQPMGGMQHDMSSTDMQGMMQHCAAMRQQQAQGVRLSPEMQQMMRQCDGMDRSMGTQAPAGTLAR